MNKNNNSNNNSATSTQDLGNGLRLIKDTTGRYAPAATAEADLLVKAIIIGDSSVGKSSLLFRFTDNNFTPTFISTIGVDYKSVCFDRRGELVKLQLWDTAGQDRFSSIINSFFRGVHSCLLVFALDDEESFENITNWVKKVHRHGSEDMKFVLVGNKRDLVERNPGLRQVSTEAAQNLAQSLGCEYLETSAKEDDNVALAFAKLTEKAIERKLASADINNPNNLRNPHKRIQMGKNDASNNNNKPESKSLCAGRCA
jgi:small GTP-binding protein